MKLLPHYIIPKGWVCKMKLRGGMLEGRGQIENEIRSCRMKMKLQWKNKYNDTPFYLRRVFYSIPL